MARIVFRFGDLVAKVTNPLAEARIARTGDLPVHLIEQGDEFIAQRLPLRGVLVAVVPGWLGLLKRAGHGGYPKHLKTGPGAGRKGAGFIAHCFKNMVKNGLSVDAFCNSRASLSALSAIGRAPPPL